MIVICKSMMELLILNLLFGTLHSKKVWCMLFINMLKTIIQQTRIDNIKNRTLPWSPSFGLCCGAILNGSLKCFFEFWVLQRQMPRNHHSSIQMHIGIEILSILVLIEHIMSSYLQPIANNLCNSKHMNTIFMCWYIYS